MLRDDQDLQLEVQPAFTVLDQDLTRDQAEKVYQSLGKALGYAGMVEEMDGLYKAGLQADEIFRQSRASGHSSFTPAIDPDVVIKAGKIFDALPLKEDAQTWPLFMGSYEIVGCGADGFKSQWSPMLGTLMSREVQIAHNIKHFPDFRVQEITP